MVLIRWIFIKFWFISSFELSCPMGLCSGNLISDSFCELLCNNVLCGFDSWLSSEELTNFEIFRGSDCLPYCLNTNCTYELLSNDKCDPECDNAFCGFD